MVGGLVEQQQVGLLEQQLGQGDAHLPAAGELFGEAGPVLLGEAETAEHGAHLGFDGVAIAGAEFGVEMVEAVGDVAVFLAGWIEFGHAVGELFELLLDGLHLGEDAHALGKDGAAGEREAVLRQVAGGDAAGGGVSAVIERVEVAEDFEEGGFAGAVGAHQSDAVFVSDEPVDAIEEELGAEAFAGC